MNVLLGLSDLLVVPPDRLRGCLLVRYGAMVPFCLLVALFGRVSPPGFARWGERVVSFGRVGVFALCAAFALAASPLRWPITRVSRDARGAAGGHPALQWPRARRLERRGDGDRFWSRDGGVAARRRIHAASSLMLRCFAAIANGAGTMISRTLERHEAHRASSSSNAPSPKNGPSRNGCSPNMLPEHESPSGSSRSRRCRSPMASTPFRVLFADIVGFTSLSATYANRNALVELLNRVFSRFDELARTPQRSRI